jgi:hypothetical protein
MSELKPCPFCGNAPYINHLTAQEIRDKLREEVASAGSIDALAEAHGVLGRPLEWCLNYGADLSEEAAIALGYRPVTIYVPITQEATNV